MESTTLYILISAVALVAIVAFFTLRRRGGPHFEKMPAEKLSGIAAEKAEHYRTQHKQSTSEELDYSRESLKSIDRVLEKNFAQNTLDEKTIADMGMYLGETLRRIIGGQWRFNEGFHELCIDLPEEGFIFPISQIRRALEHKETEPITSYVDSIAERHQGAAAAGGN